MHRPAIDSSLDGRSRNIPILRHEPPLGCTGLQSCCRPRFPLFLACRGSPKHALDALYRPAHAPTLDALERTSSANAVELSEGLRSGTQRPRCRRVGYGPLRHRSRFQSMVASTRHPCALSWCPSYGRRDYRYRAIRAYDPDSRRRSAPSACLLRGQTRRPRKYGVGKLAARRRRSRTVDFPSQRKTGSLSKDGWSEPVALLGAQQLHQSGVAARGQCPVVLILQLFGHARKE